uniref:MRG-binding protein n=1 Tax=Anopheles epiroticus TaxID=199890 RepID=A0A182P1R7_9DIPT
MTTTVREKLEVEQNLEWTAEEEVQLFLAMEGVKPAGINRHFFMACIVERLSRALQREISSETIWSHLRTLYNLKALNEQEPVPFVNDECDFCLPESDFSAVIAKRRQEDSERTAAQTSEQDSKKAETKPESPAGKSFAAKTPISSTRQDSKDGDKEDKDGKDGKDRGETGSSKLKLKNNDNAGGQDSGPKRSQKRTRGSLSTEPGHSNASSPANTPPNVPSSKRRRI